MFSHRPEDSPSDRVILSWFVLSFNGGCINVGGFLASGTFVTHVTGFATLFGLDLAKGEVEAALGILSVPIFFLAGAFLAGMLIDRPLYQGKKPHFDWVMGLSAFCLFAVAGVSPLLHLVRFGEVIALKESYLMLILLCLASGLQNGAVTTSSGRAIRTTHLTGLTTDLGLGLSRLLIFDFKKEKLHKEIRANYLRLGSILAFILGSAFGAWVFIRLGYPGFVIPALISSYAAWQGRKAKIAPHMIPDQS